MRLFYVLSILLVLVAAGESSALESTSPFKDVTKVSEDLAQDFYRAWRMRISELPQNFQQVSSPTGLQFRAPNQAGCKSRDPNALFRPVAEIHFESRITEGASLEERITYRGCDGGILLSEVWRVKSSTPVSTSIDDVVTGKRRFMLGEGETERRVVFLDPVKGPIINVDSGLMGAGGTATRFSVLSKTLVTFRSRINGDVKESRIDLEDHLIRFSRFGQRMGSRTSGMKTRFTVFEKSDDLFFRLGDSLEFTNQRDFEKSYSETVVFSLNVTAAEILEIYLSRLPKTEIAKPSVGANQRILDELQQALNRITTKTELERVRLLIQEYMAAIVSGEIGVTDNRPKQ